MLPAAILRAYLPGRRLGTAACPPLIVRCCDVLPDRLAELVPDRGQEVAVDATTIVAYANPNWKRTVRNPGRPTRMLRGRKRIRPATLRGRNGFSAIKPMWSADANHDIPLGIVVTMARRNDSPFSPAPLAGLASGHPWFSLPAGAVVIDDRGYDSKSNNAFVHRNGGVLAIHQRGLPDGKLHDDIYTAEGAPTRLGQRGMAYVRTDPDTGRHLYLCPEDGCARRDTARSVSACDDEAWENPEDNIRRFGGRIRRGSPEWNMMYAKRWSVEQVSSRWKEQGRLERHCYFGLRRVSAHARLRMPMSLAAQLDQFWRKRGMGVARVSRQGWRASGLSDACR